MREAQNEEAYHFHLAVAGYYFTHSTIQFSAALTTLRDNKK